MKFKHSLLAIIVLLLTSFQVVSDTSIPMKLNVTAVLSWSDGALINTLTEENVEIGLYSSDTEFVWKRTYALIITNGVIDATIAGSGFDSNGNSVSLTESLFEHENLKVGFTVYENGVPKLALVSLSSQPYAMKSALSDYAHSAGDAAMINGKPVVGSDPQNGQVLKYNGSEWVPYSIDNTIINIDDYYISTNDAQEVTGFIKDLKVTKLLGKKLTSAVKGGSKIPTGAVLMFSPDVNSPTGAFHPSSGNPNPGEVLTWDGSNDVWMPSVNVLSKLGDVVAPDDLTQDRSVVVYDKRASMYRVEKIGLNDVSDVLVSGAEDGQFLKKVSGKWTGSTMRMSVMSDVSSEREDGSESLAGDLLYYDGANWYPKSIGIQSLSDVNSGMGPGKILVANDLGSRFDFMDYKMSALKDVEIDGLDVGYSLVWNGEKWRPVKNKVEQINEISGFNITSDPSGKFMYHDGSDWIDKSFDFVESVSDLNDVQMSLQEVGDVLVYDGSKWVNESIKISNISDIIISNTELMDKPFLKYEDGQWKNVGIGFNDLSDIDVGQPNENDFLKYDGTNWRNTVIDFDNINNVKASTRSDGTGVQLGDAILYNGNSWEATGLNLAMMNDVDLDSASNGQVLKLANGKWKGSSMGLGSLDDVTASREDGGDVQSGDYLVYSESGWFSKEVTLKGLSDVNSGIGGEKILITNKYGTSFDYLDYTISSLKDVSTDDLEVGYALTWTGTEWKANKNKIEDINELSGFNISSDPSDKIMFHDGTEWIDKEFHFVKSVSDLTDVTIIGTSAENDVLIYDGTKWTNDAISFSKLSDIEIDNATLAGSKFMAYSDGAWRNSRINIEEMSNVYISSANADEILRFNGTNWVNSSMALANLSNVSATKRADNTSLEVGDVMKYDGTSWVVNENDLKSLSDIISSGYGANKTLVVNSNASAFKYVDFSVNSLVDTNISDDPTNRFLYHDGNEWVDKEFNIVRKIGDMQNVSITDESEGNTLMYDGSQWVNAGLPLANLGDVTISNGGLATKTFLRYVDGQWQNASVNISEISDVEINAPETNDFIRYDGEKWENTGIELDALSNVLAATKGDGTSLGLGDVIAFDGTGWVATENELKSLKDVGDNMAPGMALVANDNDGFTYRDFKIGGLVDVDVTDLEVGDAVVWDGSKWTAQSNIMLSINELSNFNISNKISTGNIISYDGSKWVDAGISASNLSGFNISAPRDGQLLKYNGNDWENTYVTIEDLNEMNLGDKEAGDAIVWDGEAWTPMPNGEMSFSSLDDVTIASPIDGEVIKYDAATQKWVNGQALSEADKTFVNNLNTALDVSDSNITMQGDITASIVTADKLYYSNVFATEADLPDATTYHGMFSHVHKTGSAYFSHSGNWVKLLNYSADGKVGIGTSAPDAMIDIEGDMASMVFKKTDAETEFGIQADADAIWVGKHSSDGAIDKAIVIDDEGNVGIGVDAPSEALDIDGDMKLSGTASIGTALMIGDVEPTTNSEIKLQIGGSASVEGAIHISGGSDLAEGFHIMADEDVSPGTVVSIDPANIGKLIVSSEAYDTKVAGVVSGGKGIKAGLIMTQTGTLADGEYPIALTGRVWVKCSNENGDIKVGDLLTTAATPGHAMRSSGDKQQGSILGKAMSPCTEDKMVLTLISLQ